MEKFSDWFDPYDMHHLRAFSCLCNTGHWPEGFMPDTVDMGNIWQYEATAKMAEAWLKHKLGNLYNERI
jgi:hypothetical protein